MSWKFAKSLAISTRVLLIFVCSTVLILSVITGLIYPPMRELLHQSHLNNEHYSYLLTQICIRKFFIGLWFSALIIIIASYLLVKKSIKPIKNFSRELASINASSLNKRLMDEGNPKELQILAKTCNEMLARIENSFGYIKQFSAAMAHELRTPIHYLQTATEITLAKPQSMATYQQLLASHLEEYQNLSRLIDNLLFLTRSERGLLQLNRQTFSARDLIIAMIDYYQALAQEKNIGIEVIGDAQIEVDQHLFKRVIANLIDNSLAYSNQGGSLQITIEKRAGVQITIQDNGVGISKEDLPYIGQGFYRGDQREIQENKGLGLGLAISKSIMEHHQGELAVESQLGLGTKVMLTFQSLKS